MSFQAAVGRSGEAHGYRAGLQAAERALQSLGRGHAAFGFFIVSHAYEIQQVLDGINEALGNVPVMGFSSTGELTGEGYFRRSVVLALIGGDDLMANAGWWSDYVTNTRASVLSMLKSFEPRSEAGHKLLISADGFNGDIGLLCSMLSEQGCMLAGCLSAGDLRREKTYQAGSRKSGSGGIAAALLGGDLLIGVGAAHGWRAVGALARLTDVNGVWVRTIDHQPVSETYARLFGYRTQDWSYPPLNELVRIYPLGVQIQGASELLVRSPLRVEMDGSLRMNSNLPEGQKVDFMIGSRETCVKAAISATRSALKELGPSRPRLALVFVDAAWQVIFESDPGGEIRGVRAVLGEDVPIVGGYTQGQIVRPKGEEVVQCLNQHIQIVLFGSKTVEI